jgi:hypothetical protein
MENPAQPVKLVPVDADLFESIGYDDLTHSMLVKFRGGATMRIENVPRFRFQGLLAAPLKDAYYRTFIKDRFLLKQV